MPDMKFSSYFYGDEAMQFTYFRIPCQLITHPRFKHLSTDSKLLYGMLLDRMSLSIKNEWYDDTGRVYIYYTVDEVCSNLNCGRDKAMRLLAELDTGKGVGLIERKKQGQGKPTRIGRFKDNWNVEQLEWRFAAEDAKEKEAEMKKDKSEEIRDMFKGVPPKNVIIAVDNLPPKTLEQHIQERKAREQKPKKRGKSR